MKIYNSLSRSKKEFEPLKPKTVSMYVCGPTVYDLPHIGHARSAYIFDLIRRYLAKYKKFKVKFVRNVTDVDDKIINKAKEEFSAENLDSAVKKVAAKYLLAYHKALSQLQIAAQGPDIIEPKASEYINKIQKFIKLLINKKAAYQAGGDVYFDITKAKKYGELSGQSLEAVEAGTRLAPTENKRNPLDFALWKSAKNAEPCWDSEWGKGRPGWHIECSVMSTDILGDQFDIHGGGLDLIFPHHENEIAQANAAGKKFARFWIHHGLLTINGQKMAKSLGNLVAIEDVLSRDLGADILKIFYLQAHYSSPVDFSWEKLGEIKHAYQRIVILRDKIVKYKSAGAATGDMQSYKQRFFERMDDNFDTPGALAVLFELINKCNKLLKANEQDKQLAYASGLIREMTEVFGLTFVQQKTSTVSDREISQKINQRADLKKQKKYQQADQIRKDLETVGVVLEDSRNGKTKWRRKI